MQKPRCRCNQSKTQQIYSKMIQKDTSGILGKFRPKAFAVVRLDRVLQTYIYGQFSGLAVEIAKSSEDCSRSVKLEYQTYDPNIHHWSISDINGGLAAALDDLGFDVTYQKNSPPLPPIPHLDRRRRRKAPIDTGRSIDYLLEKRAV